MPPTISLCLIAKDESANIDQCLRSVAGCWDQLIVVDTGSQDDTREVAVKFGASVYQFDHRNHPEAFFKDDEETCKLFGAPGPYSNEWALSDFAAARNESFKHATCDYVAWVDCDDVLEKPEALRAVVADMAARRLDLGFLPYNYAQDHLGRVFYRQYRERVFVRGCINWVNPVHEVAFPKGSIAPPGRYDAPIYSHRRKADRKSIPHRNYKILLRQLWQLTSANPTAPIDPRIMFYLGQEARFIDPKRAEGFYEEYLQGSGWPEERAAAHVALGSLCELGMLGLTAPQAYAQADREFAAAAAEMPDNPDGLFGLARIAYLRKRYQDCVNYTERGFAMKNPESMLGANPMDRLYRPHVYYNHALGQLGRIEEAIASCEAGLAVCPDDPGVPGGAQGMLQHNLDAYRKALAERNAPKPEPVPTLSPRSLIEFDRNESLDTPPAINIPRDAQVIWALQLWKQLVYVDHRPAGTFLESLPNAVKQDPVWARMQESTARRHAGSDVKWDIGVTGAPRTGVPMPRESSGLSVIFWIGPSIEPWTPRTPNETGIGGSETACIEMARELSGRGHRVLVYGECAGKEGNYDGVEYRHYQNARAPLECDVFISSRAPAILDNPDTVRAKVKLLWVHDIHVGPASPQMERWLLRFDRIMCLSNWHKDFFLGQYPWLHPDRVVVTRNGIDPRRFESSRTIPVLLDNCKVIDTPIDPPKTNRLIFSSSPNRGLDRLLALFHPIRARVPDAELHIYYGFDCWQKFAEMRGAQAELDEIARYKKAIDDAVNRGGVRWHGRVNQRELAHAFMRSKVWGYPTQFTETSCVSAMEAQAAGCVPVCTPVAALKETVKHGVFVDDPQSFVDACARLLTDEPHRSRLADAGRKYALENLSWRALAGEWEAMFRRLAGELAGAPVAAWKDVA